MYKINKIINESLTTICKYESQIVIRIVNQQDWNKYLGLCPQISENVMECVMWCKALVFTPNQLIKKLLNTCSGQERQCVLEDFGNSTSKILHNRAVIETIIRCHGTQGFLNDVVKSQILKCCTVNGEVC